MESKPTQTTINIQLIKKNNCPMKNYIFYIAVFSISIGSVYSQESEFNSQEIFYELRQKDSLVFNLGFNHDQNGILKSKEILIQSIPNLCKMDYKPIRVLIDNSLQVFPLFSNGKIYGAIQTGIHEFYGEEKDKPRYLTSTAKFTHVWIIEGGEWKLKRILSYDHVIPRK